MRFPFVLRTQHEAEIAQWRNKVIGLARTLYEGQNVPEEMQLLLGVTIPKITDPAPIVPEPQESVEASEEQQEEERRGEIQRRLNYVKRTNPSMYPAAAAAAHKLEVERMARNAHPSAAVFARAKEEALKPN